jgi:hypothetical protein
LSYLQPPPMPAPVIVTKDVGGFVTDYQTQTAVYKATGREVRLHECRSACTMALSLPNVCVYPDSTLKFHMAYDPRNHQPNAQVSQQLFDSYPAAVRARLGTLTQQYKVLRGSELIALGVRDCNAPATHEPKIMVASAPAGKTPPTGPSSERPLFPGLIDKMLSVFGSGEAGPAHDRPIALRRPAPGAAPVGVLLAEAPLLPPRQAEFAEPVGAIVAKAEAMAPGKPDGELSRDPPPAPELNQAEQAAGMPLPPHSPADTPPSAGKLAVPQTPAQRHKLPKIIAGAQPILPPGFSAYADSER